MNDPVSPSPFPPRPWLSGVRVTSIRVCVYQAEMINVGRGEETIPTVLYFREHGCSLNQLLTQSYTVYVVGLTVVVHISQATGPQTIPVLTSRRDCIVPRSTYSFKNGKKSRPANGDAPPALRCPDETQTREGG